MFRFLTPVVGLFLLLSLPTWCWAEEGSLELRAVHEYEMSEPQACVAVSRDGKLLAAGAFALKEDGRVDVPVVLFDAVERKEKFKLRIPELRVLKVDSLVFTPDSQHLIAALRCDAPVIEAAIFECATGKLLHKFAIHDGDYPDASSGAANLVALRDVKPMRDASDEPPLFVAALLSPPSLRWFDETGHLIRKENLKDLPKVKIPDSVKRISTVFEYDDLTATTDAGIMAVIADYYGIIVYKDQKQHSSFQVNDVDFLPISRCAMNPKGTLIAMKGERFGSNVKFYNLEGVYKGTLSGQLVTVSMAFSPDSAKLACAGSGIRVFDLATETSVDLDGRELHFDVAWNPDGSIVYVAREKGLIEVSVGGSAK